MKVLVLAPALALALLAAPAMGQPPSTTVSPVTVEPTTKKPPPPDAKIQTDDPDQLFAVWPAGVISEGFEAHVRLHCLIDVHGLAEHCEVADETPSGKGFGRAALELRPTIKLAPVLKAGRPVAAEKTIGVTFVTPEDNAPERKRVTMLNAPVWVAAASFDDLVAATPANARGQEGYVVEHCAVRRNGRLEGCYETKEEPAGLGFANAALALARKFRVDPQIAAAPYPDELWVDLPIRFPGAEELQSRTVMAPSWLATFDPSQGLKLFPPEAVAAGLTTGRGVARCVVGRDGVLGTCTPEAGDPDGLGFSEVAARLASTMKMNLWSNDGAPVEGGVVHIPIRLNLKGG